MGLFGRGAAAGQLGLRGELSLGAGVLPTLNAGILRITDGRVLVRDVQLGLRLLPIRTDTVLWSVEPGVNLPLGSVGADAGTLPTTTSSVDPILATDLVVGGQALLLLGGQLRAPLVEGRDDLRQGPYARADLRGGWRAGAWVPTLGLSGVRQADPGGELWELALVAAASIELGSSTGLGVSARVPLWTDASERYAVAPGVSLRQVIRTSKRSP